MLKYHLPYRQCTYLYSRICSACRYGALVPCTYGGLDTLVNMCQCVGTWSGLLNTGVPGIARVSYCEHDVLLYTLDLGINVSATCAFIV